MSPFTLSLNITIPKASADDEVNGCQETASYLNITRDCYGNAEAHTLLRGALDLLGLNDLPAALAATLADLEEEPLPELTDLEEPCLTVGAPVAVGDYLLSPTIAIYGGPAGIYRVTETLDEDGDVLAQLVKATLPDSAEKEGSRYSLRQGQFTPCVAPVDDALVNAVRKFPVGCLVTAGRRYDPVPGVYKVQSIGDSGDIHGLLLKSGEGALKRHEGRLPQTLSSVDTVRFLGVLDGGISGFVVGDRVRLVGRRGRGNGGRILTVSDVLDHDGEHALESGGEFYCFAAPSELTLVEEGLL